jgi:branched-chain amino acid transport system substrate-binding protein
MRAQLRRATFLLATALTVSAVFVSACGSSKEEAGGGQGASPGDTTGVTDTEIKLGTLMPLSGSPTAAWGIEISKGMQAYFDWLNNQGGLYGRKIKVIVGDSQYSGPIATEAVRKLVEQDEVFALSSNLGTEVEAAVAQYLEERNIPDMYVLTGASQFIDPVAKNRFSAMVNYTTEGKIFATYLFQNYDGKKLGILAQNDDYGKEGEAGTRQGLKDLGAKMDVTTEYYDVAQADVTAQMQRLKVDGVDVIMFWGSPTQAANMTKTARQTLSWDVPMLINEANALDITAQLAGYDNIEGVVSTVVGHQAFETNVPAVAKIKEEMASVASDLPFDNSTLVGWTLGSSMAGLLKQTGRNLTRENFLAAAEDVCKYMTDLSLIPSTSSQTDHSFTEAEIFVKATVDRSGPSPTFRWEPFGDVVGFESTKDCTVPTPPANATEQPGPPLGIEVAQ